MSEPVTRSAKHVTTRALPFRFFGNIDYKLLDLRFHSRLTSRKLRGSIRGGDASICCAMFQSFVQSTKEVLPSLKREKIYLR